MKAVFVADLHGKFGTIVQLPAADILVVGGDITNFGGADDLREFAKVTAAQFPCVVAVAGNCDPSDAEICLLANGCGISQDGRREGFLRFFGISGAPYHHGSTPYEWPDDMTAPWLPCKIQSSADEQVVLVSHAPPVGAGTTCLRGGLDAGSRAVAEAVRRLRPVLVLSGHIHEARGIFRMKGGALAVNPGPLRSGHYAAIEFCDGLPPVVSLCTL